MKFDRRTFLKASAAACCQGLLSPVSVLRAQESPGPHTREAYFYRKLSGSTVQCRTCPHECVIHAGDRGRCRTKENFSGELRSISYGNPCTVHVDPIEKKPLLHFHPGATAFSLACAGCNFTCLNCQNWEISQTSPDKTRNYNLPPERVVAAARKYKCQAIAYTYSEATTFYEYMVDTSALARDEGIKNVWVSNGFMQRPAVEKLCKTIDAAALNFKSFSDETYKTLCGGRLAPVMDTFRTVKDNGVWLELIHLMVPTYTDKLDEVHKMCAWIAESLGPETPISFSRFFPRYRLTHLPATPVETLVAAREAALSEGLLHAYVGNVAGLGDTVVCGTCKKPVVERRGYQLLDNRLKNGHCPYCGQPVAGRWS